MNLNPTLEQAKEILSDDSYSGFVGEWVKLVESSDGGFQPDFTGVSEDEIVRICVSVIPQAVGEKEAVHPKHPIYDIGRFWVWYNDSFDWVGPFKSLKDAISNFESLNPRDSND